MIWFTSDLHLGHTKVLEFAGRPWDTIDEMNDALIANINARVAQTDTLYILGDYSFKIDLETAYALRQKINCRDIHLVPGNHDKDWTRPEVAGAFTVEPMITTIKVHDGRQKIVLSHFPLADWPSMRRGSWHLHGHIHSSRGGYNAFNLRQNVLRYDVGVDANAYAPVSLDEISDWFGSVDEPSGRIRWPYWVNVTADPELDEELQAWRDADAS